MNILMEQQDTLNSPYEAFLYDTSHDCFPIKAHWHYFMELIYMESGTGLISCDGTEYLVRPGDMILFHPQSVHSIYSSQDQLIYSVLKFDINNLHINSSYTPHLGSIFKSAVNEETAPVYFPANLLYHYPVAEEFHSCIQEISHKDYGYDIRFQSIVSSLLVEILRIWRKNGFDTDKVALPSPDINSLYTIVEYIDEHSNEPLMVKDLADRCGMSYSYFASSFRQLYGQSCKDYIEFIRISKVKDYLLFTSFDLSYISQDTGFSDCSHLIKTFKKITGTTPKQFRLSHVKEKTQARG
ncbi:MAG: AraC family transcriptional regulator [Lachnospiraceae bacterium]